MLKRCSKLSCFFLQNLMEVLKQKKSMPVTVGCQVIVVYAVINGYLNDVAVKDVAAWEKGLYVYLQDQYAGLLKRIEEGHWEQEDIDAAKSALEGYRR